MANKKKIKTKPKPAAAPAIPQAPPIFVWTRQVKYTILLVLGFFFYANTTQNQYALDDGGVILANQYVQQGISGIGKIMTTDAFASYLQKMGAGQQLTGGRYRPLSIVVFAIQQSLFGNSPFVRHLFNVLCFLATIFVMFYFLSKYMFKRLPYGEDMAFVATALFIIHPIHTEVVANIKSLDEILSLLFILCTLTLGLKYTEEKKQKHLIGAMVCYLLALLSKEYGTMMMILIPMFFYLYPGSLKGKAITSTVPYGIVFFIYLLMRFSAVGIPHGNANVRLLNNQLRVDPYYFATHAQKFATEWYSLGKYVVMLFFPYPLSSDYSYSQIPYHNFSDISVWVSIFLYIAITVWGIKLYRKKNIMAFAVFFFLFSLLPVSNFFINVGAMFGERFAYHASFGFVILVTYGLFYLLREVPIKTKQASLMGILSVLVLACGAEVITRNRDWSNNTTLFTTDIKNAPNSSFVNCNAASCYINMALKKENEKRSMHLLDSAVACLYKGLRADSTFPDLYLNMGIAYLNMKRLDSAKKYFDLVQYRWYPNHPDLKRFMPLLNQYYVASGNCLNHAMDLGKEGKTEEAIQFMRQGLSMDSGNIGLWYNLGGAYFVSHKLDSASWAWRMTLKINPNYANAQRGLQAIQQQQQTKQ